jgi:hypothetical protein
MSSVISNHPFQWTTGNPWNPTKTIEGRFGPEEEPSAHWHCALYVSLYDTVAGRTKKAFVCDAGGYLAMEAAANAAALGQAISTYLNTNVQKDGKLYGNALLFARQFGAVSDDVDPSPAAKKRLREAEAAREEKRAAVIAELRV